MFGGPEGLQKLLDKKADKSDIESLRELKSNKCDTEVCLKGIEAVQ